jgi:8-oxo-dGTP pyrophosphatase MutT (NUDIX family)
VWVIKRPDGMRHHARELAFPGGKAEPSDPSLLATALRETEEELGVARIHARPLGALTPIPPYTSRFVIHPFVVAIDAGVAPSPAPGEIAELIRTPVTAFFDGRVPYEAVMWNGKPSPIFRFASGPMYGASAHILRELLETWGALAGRALPDPTRVDELPFL